MSFRKTIFTFKSVFYKDDFERVHISNKHHKSHVWPKNKKYIYIFFSNFGPPISSLFFFIKTLNSYIVASKTLFFLLFSIIVFGKKKKKS
jgi:hypothetical protein